MTLQDVIRSLPLRHEELLRAAGYRRDLGPVHSLSTSLGLFGLGVAIGAGVALLCAPEPGRALRRRLADRFEEATSPPRRQDSARESAH